MTSKCSTISRFPRRKSGTGKSLSSEVSVGHWPDLELAARAALRDARDLVAEEILVDEEAANSGHPTREEMKHRLLGRTVGERQSPDCGPGRGAAARPSRACSGPTGMRSSCGLAVDALALRAGMVIPGFPRCLPREPPRMPGQMYRTFAPGCLP